MSWLTSPWHDLAIVLAKVAIMYCTALVGLRLAERRTLAQWTIIDFAAAVAVGAVIGRTTVAQSQSVATGVVALLGIVGMHRLFSLLRFTAPVAAVADHRVRVLVAHGDLRRGELRRCGLTDADVYAELRLRGVFDLAELEYALYETKGGLTLVRRGTPEQAPLLVQGLESSVGFPDPAPGGAG